MNEQLQNELEEQARLLGMSAERECALRGKLERERALADRLAEILQRIANEDYRGNRPHHCVVADCGVKAWREARSE